MHFRKMRICYRNVNRSLAIRAGPKFHIVAPDFQVLVRISVLTVIAGEARPAQIAEVIAWSAGQACPVCPQAASIFTVPPCG